MKKRFNRIVILIAKSVSLFYQIKEKNYLISINVENIKKKKIAFIFKPSLFLIEIYETSSLKSNFPFFFSFVNVCAKCLSFFSFCLHYQFIIVICFFLSLAINCAYFICFYTVEWYRNRSRVVYQA